MCKWGVGVLAGSGVRTAPWLSVHQCSAVNLMSNIMATFHPNPDESGEPWIERSAIDSFGFRVWHVIFLCFAICITIVILICCCVKIRIPRTKQEIEANYRRKRLVQKFRERIRLIHNQEMDEIDLKRALEIIQEDYKTEANNIKFGCDVTEGCNKESKLRRIVAVFGLARTPNNNQPENNI